MARSKFLRYFLFVTLIVIILDQLVKFLIFHFRPVWNLKILTIEFITNTGAGFGILQGQTIWLAIISLLAAALVIFYYKELPQEKFPQFLAGLFLGGIIGNLLDRLFRGYVIDFVNFHFFPVFNLADTAISLAAIGLIYVFWKKK